MSSLLRAASVVLTRDDGPSEVFLVRRSQALRFFGGYLAFPGGKVDPGDTPTTEIHDADRRFTAVRELFEETGVLLARRPDNSLPWASQELEAERHALLQGRTTFADILRRHDLTLRDQDLLPVGRLITPPFVPLRFDTAFFVADLPSGQEPVVWPGELESGRWAAPDDIISEWTQGRCLVSPPTLTILQALQGRSARELPKRLAPLLSQLNEGVIPPIHIAPQVRLIPLRTQGLPPSTHTNAYLIGRDPAYLLDPGPVDPAEQHALFQVLDEELAAGTRLRAVVLTHFHPDHVGAANACAVRYQIPVWAHGRTQSLLKDRVTINRPLADGDLLELGTAPDGSGPWHLEAVHTPGHASDHLAFWEPHYRLLFAGDLVSTLSSVVIAPPDGDLAVYLQSLEKAQRLQPRLLLPAHGGVSARPRETLQDCMDHRRRREEHLLAALGTQPRTVEELTREIYSGLPQELIRFAVWQVQAGLLKLQREGKVVVQEGARWVRCLQSLSSEQAN